MLVERLNKSLPELFKLPRLSCDDRQGRFRLAVRDGIYDLEVCRLLDKIVSLAHNLQNLRVFSIGFRYCCTHILAPLIHPYRPNAHKKAVKSLP